MTFLRYLIKTELDSAQACGLKLTEWRASSRIEHQDINPIYCKVSCKSLPKVLLLYLW